MKSDQAKAGSKQPVLPCYATLTAVKTLPVSVQLSEGEGYKIPEK